MTEYEFDQFVISQSNRLFGFCFKIVGNSDDAKDILQDIFTVLWQRRDKVADIQNVSAFVTTMARNKCIDYIRKNQAMAKQRNAMELNAEPEATGGDNEEERLALVHFAMKELPLLQQQVLLMRDFQGLEFVAIAEELNLSQENVRMTLSRARKKVKKIIIGSNLLNRLL
ncbi:MAG: sigma-70 family RNA polymerase sigma factor [Tenuifilaceae bacterium]|jgi:RNA polymerase sigma-70 factor (ECF subfamily)|nr:sigma-70 family RNA polymerase sigma factor [Tenuifilaceae bacterium]